MDLNTVGWPWYFVLFILCFCQPFISNSSSIEDLQAIPSSEETAKKLERHFLGHDEELPLKRSKRQLFNYFDVVYIIDSSSSISELEFKRGIRAVQEMIRKSKASSKHALITVATQARLVLEFTSQGIAVNKLRMLRRTGGKTNTQEALQVCHDIFEKPGRHGGRELSFKRVLVITDGQSNIRRNMTIPIARRLKAQGIEVFVIAVGEYLDGIDELSKMASSPNAHMYRVEDMSGLVLVVKLIPKSLDQWRNNIFGGRPGDGGGTGLDGLGILQET
ncbi:uncharacterized protein LOC116288997 [Actinia tenebrosa]|uniref:Uncharacterized protein LOC116288997 n=1 Tax=Actinia tenebrosa TaxID=6105 RepID=A0A6P8H921_ACTTE|nr:uncharacterized protein LOC116288997 [Actinia tenebrosa]